jgi:hypothetical protein
MVFILVAMSGLGVGWWARAPQAESALAAPATLAQSTEAQPAVAAANDPLVLSYAAKFSCLEPLQPGQVSYSLAAPIVGQQTEVSIHNPNDFPVVLYKKAVRAPLEDLPPIPPGRWKELVLEPDHAVRVDCDDIAKLLTGNQSATFLNTFGIGVKVEGFVVVAIGPNPGTTPADIRYSPLDVVATYVRNSEVLKKDIGYQPWWTWWWRWPLPWRLGYPYQRLVPIDATQNIDCRGNLVQALHDDVEREMAGTPDLAAQTHLALDIGLGIGPATVMGQSAEAEPALVAMVGRCDKVDPGLASVDYVLLSNKGPTDPEPIQPTGDQTPQFILYPWIPGRWHDLTVVVPQNVTKDLDAYIRDWHAQLWLESGVDAAIVNDAMPYFFPYWCGWGYWWWWWNGGDCIDIGVGEGESIDVEQITPVRVIMSQWPPP